MDVPWIAVDIDGRGWKRGGAREEEKMSSSVCDLSDNANRLSHITVLFPLFQRLARRELVVSHYTGAEKSEKAREEREQGLSACPDRRHHSLPRRFSRAFSSATYSRVLRDFANVRVAEDDNGIADALNENLINRLFRFNAYWRDNLYNYKRSEK